MRRPIIAGNWKMNKTSEEAILLSNGIKRDLFDIQNIEIVLCPPFTSLSDVRDVILDTNIILGAQNMHWQAEGAFTGEIAPGMLKHIGCKYVIIGHSERRIYFGETNETVEKKVRAALKENLSPILCVGEKLKERENGKTFDVVSEHVEKGLLGVGEKEILDVVIAYEPVWAIGTGKNATPDQAQEVHKFIRGILSDKYGKEISDNVRIQYGGSVNPDNIADLIKEKDIDGALVGGASIKEGSFVDLVKRASDIVKEK
ncbi:MAG: triose-phosphate isomerase [Omnitrophica bacterium RBG_13_46_9]|nr:MAG: triose-phosphate isomerase [Omnitrophica bacterium RBG_13_46_9]